MLCLLVGGPDESSDESKIRRYLHREAGALPRFHPYLFVHVRTAARRGRHSAPLPRQPAFGPPDDRHPGAKRLHPTSARRPQKHRNHRAARKLAYPRMARYQNVKITVMNHYRVGENVVIEYRFTNGQAERLPALAAELVRV